MNRQSFQIRNEELKDVYAIPNDKMYQSLMILITQAAPEKRFIDAIKEGLRQSMQIHPISC